MDLRMTYITRLLALITLLLACMQFSACFDIPSEPKTNNTLKSATVQIQQGNNTDSLLLKIHPTDSATLTAVVYPKKIAEDIEFSWYHQEGDTTSQLGSGQTFQIKAYASKNQIPNQLVITDKEGNSISTEFDVIINSPPSVSSDTYPAKGDTLYKITPTQSIQFKWKSSDNDREALFHTIIIDTAHYDLGELTSIYQSGFTEGEHTFQVFVTDEYGDTDSTAVISFYVTKSEKAEE